MATKILRENEEYRLNSKSVDIFSDFNHFFKANPFTGDIGRKTQAEAVKQSIRNIVLTNKYERLRNPRFGSRISRFLFEPFNDNKTADEIAEEIERSIQKYEPRAIVEDITVRSDEEQNAISVVLVYSIQNVERQETLNLTLYRVR